MHKPAHISKYPGAKRTRIGLCAPVVFRPGRKWGSDAGSNKHQLEAEMPCPLQEADFKGGFFGNGCRKD
jgi:hypothetical protein